MRAGLSQVASCPSEAARTERRSPAGSATSSSRASLETLRELLQACGFDLELSLVPFLPPEPRRDARLQKALERTPQERLQAMLRARRR